MSKDVKMTDQVKPGAAPAASAIPQQALSGDVQALTVLVQLLLAERQEALLEKQEKSRIRERYNAQIRANIEQDLRGKNESQKLCSHKKGGKGMRGPKVDYAVSFHTFVDASSYIRCLICGMKWKNQDTSEYLIRRGQKIPNHTGISWAEAYHMLSESSNTATASEVQLTTRPVQHTPENFEGNPNAVEI
jgi:hypothetical protein